MCVCVRDTRFQTKVRGVSDWGITVVFVLVVGLALALHLKKRKQTARDTKQEKGKPVGRIVHSWHPENVHRHIRRRLQRSRKRAAAGHAFVCYFRLPGRV